MPPLLALPPVDTAPLLAGEPPVATAPPLTERPPLPGLPPVPPPEADVAVPDEQPKLAANRRATAEETATGFVGSVKPELINIQLSERWISLTDTCVLDTDDAKLCCPILVAVLLS